MGWERLPPSIFARQDAAVTTIKTGRGRRTSSDGGGNGSSNNRQGTSNGKKNSKNNNNNTSKFNGIIVVGGQGMRQQKQGDTIGNNNINDIHDNNQDAAVTIQPLETVELFEWGTQRWWGLPSLKQARSGCAVASIENIIIVVGGVCNNVHLDSAELFIFGSSSSASSSHADSLSNLEQSLSALMSRSVNLDDQNDVNFMDENLSDRYGWQHLLPMSTRRWFPAAVGLNRHQAVVVMGGRDQQWQELSSVEAFHLQDQSWRTLAPMRNPRFACAAVSIGPSSILVLGGFNGHQWITSVECYNFEHDSWTDLPPMPLPMEFGSAASVARGGRYVFCVGAQQISDDENYFVSSAAASVSSRQQSPMYQHHQTSNQPQYTYWMQCYNVREKRWSKWKMNNQTQNPTSNSSVRSRQTTRFRQQQQQQLMQQYQPRFEGCRLVAIDQTLLTFGGGGYGAFSNPNNKQQSHLQQQQNRHLRCWKLTDADFEDDGNTISGNSAESENVWVAPLNGIVPTAVAVHPDHMSVATRHVAVLEVQSIASPPSLDGVARGPLAGFAASTATSSSGGSGGDGNKHETRRIENAPTVDCTGKEGWYTGDVSVINGKPHGQGLMRWEHSGDQYNGEWKLGAKDGYGKMTYANGDIFEGWYRKDKRSGRGTYQWSDGKQYEGLYAHDKCEDPNATMTWKNGTIFIGQFVKNQRTGKGVIRFPNNVRYQGDFVQGKYDGYGTCVFSDGRVYSGHWKKGKAHGKGVLTEANGRVVHDGNWSYDVPVFNET